MNAKYSHHKTKIVCTIGPASRSQNVIERLMRRGMNVARLNFSHGTLEGHKEDIRRIRSVAAKLNRSCTILADLPGIKIRIGRLNVEPVELVKGNRIALTTNRIIGNAERLFVNYERLNESVDEGSLIYLNDGFIQLLVEKITPEEILCRVLVGGPLLSHKGVSLPGAKLYTNSVTTRDLELVDFGIKEGVDAFGISFAEKSEDNVKIRRFIRKKDGSAYQVAKIERAEAVENIDAILETADAIMIARGDLGVQIPLEDLPGVQKTIIRKANILGRPVITATQMLLSMTDHIRPTRAEVSDVANAILDGTDAVMLSEETAIGRYPVAAVDMMARIAATVERDRKLTEGLSGIREYFRPLPGCEKKNIDDVISYNVVESAHALAAPYIVVSSMKGDESRKLSRFKPDCWIVAFCADEKVKRFMDLSYGVLPVTIQQGLDNSLAGILRYAIKARLIPEKALVVATGDFHSNNIAGERWLRIIVASLHGSQSGTRGRQRRSG